MTDVFISYARADQPVSAALCALLESEGWDVWFDQELRAGEKWESSLLEVLERRRSSSSCGRRTRSRASG